MTLYYSMKTKYRRNVKNKIQIFADQEILERQLVFYKTKIKEK